MTHHSPWLRKPLWVVRHQEHRDSTSSTTSLPRHLSLFDLVSVGVGGTVGSGIFVLAGYIAHHHAGPATAVSFLVSGLAACCSGVCYAELAGRIPVSGSTYAYAYVAMGELPAVLAAACLTLEYAVSGAAVARSWGDKVVVWLVDDWGWTSAQSYLVPGYGLNPMAFVVSAASVILVLDGVQETKFVTNIFTTLKVVLVLFMTVGGFCLWNTENIQPFAPFGTSGILRGATSSFFGYLGYDEVCCIAGEALHPERNLPRAILWTLGIVTSLYITATMALVGMQPYLEISDTSGFPAAFRYNGLNWAAQVAAAGEVLTLPVVVLISLMAQPRLQLALVQDGLLPPIFGRVDESGTNLRSGALISGVAMTVAATCVPFGYLDDLISAGILVAFSMTNGCLILMRCEPPMHRPHLLGQSLILFNILCFVTGLLSCHATSPCGIALTLAFATVTAGTAYYMAWHCPRSRSFGGSAVYPRTQVEEQEEEEHHEYFETPCVPFLPCIGTFLNWYLIAQLEAFGILLLVLYLGLAAAFYFCFGAKHSVGNSRGWKRGNYQGLAETDPDTTIMLRTISLPKVAPLDGSPRSVRAKYTHQHDVAGLTG